MRTDEPKPGDRPRGLDPRKPYVKPTCDSEKILETTPLACGKVPGQGGICNSAPSSS